MFILLINNVLLLPTTNEVQLLHGYESANPQLWLHEIKQYTCKAHCIKTNRKRGIMLTLDAVTQ